MSYLGKKYMELEKKRVNELKDDDFEYFSEQKNDNALGENN